MSECKGVSSGAGGGGLGSVAARCGDPWARWAGVGGGGGDREQCVQCEPALFSFFSALAICFVRNNG